MPSLSHRVNSFTDSVIRRMTRIADAHGAINLSQGFPDFDPPREIMDALACAAHHGPHQYAVTFGAPDFREALVKKHEMFSGLSYDPQEEVVVTCGGTEAMICAMMAVCNPGDKAVVFSPVYENYAADAILSGAEPIYVPDCAAATRRPSRRPMASSSASCPSSWPPPPRPCGRSRW